ncbi:hypothetical protein CHUAL_001695 [Chamberlinius hualienensis]
MFMFHSDDSDLPTRLLPIENVNLHIKEAKREAEIQTCLDEYFKCFKFKPIIFLRYATNVESVFRQLTKIEEEELHKVFIALLAPFLFHQRNKEDILKQLSDYIRSAFHLDFDLKFEEITTEQETKIFNLVELIGEILLEVFQWFNPLSTNLAKSFSILVDCKETSKIIILAKPVCERVHGISSDSRVAVCAFVILTCYYCQSKNYVLADLYSEENDGVELKKVDDEKQLRIQYFDCILKQNPFDYQIHVEFAKAFLTLNCNSYAKWAAYKAIIISPSYIDSYPVYFEARFHKIAHSTIIRKAVIKLSEEIEIFAGDKYKDFKFMEDWAYYLNSSKKLFELDVTLKPSTRVLNKLLKQADSINHLNPSSNTNRKTNPNFKSNMNSGKPLAVLTTKNIIEENTGSIVNNFKDSGETSNLIKAPEKKSKKKRSDKASFKKVAKEGSEAYCQSSFLVAIQKYELALNIVTEKGYSELNLSILDVVTLKYCFAISCIYKHTKEYIMKGLNYLAAIINDYPKVSFPLAYFGQAVGLMSQNRFTEAKYPLTTLLSIFEKNVQFFTLCYPGSNKVIEESVQTTLKEKVDNFMAKCRSPPPPDGICCYESDCADHYNKIYYNDPDFVGFARVTCSDRCHLYFHYDCWENVKDEKKLRRKKDFEEMTCVTPDCKGRFLKIEFVGADGIARKEPMISNELKGKPDKETRTPPLQLSKLKKETKKTSRDSYNPLPRRCRTNSDVSDDNISVVSLNSPISDFNEVVPDLRVDGVPLCKKKLDLTEPASSFKKPKKSTSSKIVIIPEFKIVSSDRSEELVRDNVNDNITNSFETSYLNNNHLNETFDEFQYLSNACDEESLKESVLSYLENFVHNKGTPVKIDDASLLDELNSFPVEAQAYIVKSGGIENLLKNSKKLLVLGRNIVAQENKNLDHLHLFTTKNVKEVDRFNHIDNGIHNGGLYRTTSYSFGLQSNSYRDRKAHLTFSSSEKLTKLSDDNCEPHADRNSVNGDLKRITYADLVSGMCGDCDAIENCETITQHSQIVNQTMKTFSSLNSTDQLEICYLITTIANISSETNKRLSSDNKVIRNFFKDFNNTYVTMKKNEVIENEKFENLKHEKETIQRKLEYAKKEILTLQTENQKLFAKKATMLEEISVFLEAYKRDQVGIKDRLYNIQSEKENLAEENKKLKELIQSLKNDGKKLFDDNAKMAIEHTKKMNESTETIKLLEQERNSLKAELQNWTINRATFTNNERMDSRFMPTSSIPRIQGRPYYPVANGISHQYQSFHRDPFSTHPPGYIPKLPLLPTPTYFSPVLIRPESLFSRQVFDCDNLPSISQQSLKISKQSNNTNELISDSNLSNQTDLKHEKTLVSETAYELPTLIKPSSVKNINVENANPPGGMQLNLSSVYPTNKQSGAVGISYASAVTRQSTDEDSFGKYWRIIQLVQPEFPNLKRDDFLRHFYKIRRDYGNTFSRMRFRDIISKLRQEINNKNIDKGAVSKLPVSSLSSLGLGSFSEASCAWKNLPQPGSMFDSESEYADEICAICHESMIDKLHRLRCGHVHHLKCLEGWYKLQSTCPICREHCPLTDDFPPLK